MKRIVPGLLIAGLWLLLLIIGSVPIFNVVIILAVFLGGDEFIRMTTSPVTSVDRVLLNCIITIPAVVASFSPDASFLMAGLLGAFGVAVSYALYRYRALADCFQLLSRMGFGIFYVGVLASFLILLRALPEGASWVLIASAITASSDSGAYFVGKKLGRRKLCPNISPNKTVEGAVGGIISAVIMALFFAWLLLPSFSVSSLVPVTIILTLVGIAGDLTESIIKRGTGTKDSGRCLAGHGGILDRVDSLLFVAPVLYYFHMFSVV